MFTFGLPLFLSLYKLFTESQFQPRSRISRCIFSSTTQECWVNPRNYGTGSSESSMPVTLPLDSRDNTQKFLRTFKMKRFQVLGDIKRNWERSNKQREREREFQIISESKLGNE